MKGKICCCILVMHVGQISSLFKPSPHQIRVMEMESSLEQRVHDLDVKYRRMEEERNSVMNENEELQVSVCVCKALWYCIKQLQVRVVRT